MINTHSMTNEKNNESGFVALILILVLILGLIIAMVIFTVAAGAGFQFAAGEPTASDGQVPIGVEMPDGSVELPPIPGNCLIWAWKVEPSFVPAVRAGSARLGLDPNWVMAIMAFETGRSFSPCRRNDAGSGATGLIQFMPLTAAEMGTSTDALCRMSQTGQWRYVEEYLRRKIRAHGRPKDLGGAYMLVLDPVMAQSAESSVMWLPGRGGTRIYWKSPGSCPKGSKNVYCQNRGLDNAPRDGQITKFEAASAARAAYNQGYAGCARGGR